MCRIIHTIYTTCFHTTTISQPCFGLKSIISSRHVCLPPSSTLHQHTNTLSKSTNQTHESITLHELCPSCISTWKSYGVSETEAERSVKAWRERHGEDRREKLVAVLDGDGRVCVWLDHSQDYISESSKSLTDLDKREDETITFWTNASVGPGSGFDMEARYLDELGFNAALRLTEEVSSNYDELLNHRFASMTPGSSPKQDRTVLSSEVQDFEFLVDEVEKKESGRESVVTCAA